MAGGFMGPGRTPRRDAPVPVRATRVSAGPSPVARATHITFYDPSRVIKREHLKVVKDLRAPAENAEERGEVQEGDNGITGPGSDTGVPNGAIAPPLTNGVARENTEYVNPYVPIAIAVAAFLLFGG